MRKSNHSWGIFARKIRWCYSFFMILALSFKIRQKYRETPAKSVQKIAVQLCNTYLAGKVLIDAKVNGENNCRRNVCCNRNREAEDAKNCMSADGSYREIRF